MAVELNVNAAHPNVVASNENSRLIGKDMIPAVVECQPNIVYPTFGQANFHLKTNVINIFQNAL